jgi:quercetin dioxygenase-like cupin family protein
MKPLPCLVAFAAILAIVSAQTTAPTAMPTPTPTPPASTTPAAAAVKSTAGKMDSQVILWESLKAVATATGQRRDVFELPTPTLDKFHCHISTLNPGENTGALHRHPQEELVIIKEGTLEINIDGKKQTATTGSMIFYAANENENMTNVGKTPATYYVIQFYTALTPKA